MICPGCPRQTGHPDPENRTLNSCAACVSSTVPLTAHDDTSGTQLSALTTWRRHCLFSDTTTAALSLTLRMPTRQASTDTFQRLMQGTYRPPTANHPDLLALSSLTETLHDVVPEKIGEQDHDVRSRRQRRSAALVGAVTSADMPGDMYSILTQHIRNITQAISPDNKCIHAKPLLANDLHLDCPIQDKFASSNCSRYDCASYNPTHKGV